MSAAWLTGAAAFLPALAIVVVLAARGSIMSRLAAVQLAGVLAVFLLVILDFAFDQPSSIDLALGLALLTAPAGLLFALVYERWL